MPFPCIGLQNARIAHGGRHPSPLYSSIRQSANRVAVAEISREWSAAHPTDERKPLDDLLL